MTLAYQTYQLAEVREPAQSKPSRTMTQNLLSLALSSYRIRPKGQGTQLVPAQRLSTYPAGDYPASELLEPAHKLTLSFSADALQKVTQEHQIRIKQPLSPQIGIVHPVIPSLMQALWRADQLNLPDHALYTESVWIRICLLLVQIPNLQLQSFGQLQLNRLQDYLQAHPEQMPSLNELAALVHLSPSHFAHSFRQLTGITPHRYVLQQKINLAQALLKDQTVSETAHSLGFYDHSHFSRVFRQYSGMSPSHWQQTQAKPVSLLKIVS